MKEESKEKVYAEAEMQLENKVEIQELQATNPKSEYKELVLKIMKCGIEYIKIKKELKEFNSKKKYKNKNRRIKK